MTQFIKPQNGGGKGGGTGDMLKSVYDPNNVEANAFDYNNFINTPSIPAAQVQSDWDEVDNTKVDYIKNKPTIPTKTSDLNNDSGFIDKDVNNLTNYTLSSSLATVATSGDYDDLSDKPDLSVYQTVANMKTDLANPDNNHYPTTKAVSDAISGGGMGDMLKATYDPNNVNANAFDYNNFINTPSLATVATSGDYTDLSNKPTIPTVNDATLTITQNGVSKGTFTANQSSAATIALTDTTYTAGTGIDITGNVISNTQTSAEWGNITGTLSDQTDLNTALTNITDVIPSEATSSNKLADKNYVNDGINSVTAYYITKNANGDQFATYAELNAATTFYSGGVQRTPTRNDYCIVQADENHDNATTRYIYNASWEYQYTVNETALTTAQLNALNSGITSAKVTTYDGYASTKQDKLVSGTNIKTVNGTSVLGSGDIVTPNTTYTAGTNINIDANNEISATDTTYTAGTGLALNGTEFSNSGVTSVNGSTGSVTVSEFTPSGTATTGYVLKKTADGYGWDAESGAVTSVNGQTGAVTVSEFNPASAGTTDQVLTKTAGGYDWATPAASGIVCDPNSPIQIDKIRCGTESDYSNLGSYSEGTAYLTV